MDTPPAAATVGGVVNVYTVAIGEVSLTSSGGDIINISLHHQCTADPHLEGRIGALCRRKICCTHHLQNYEHWSTGALFSNDAVFQTNF
jgi:hypothetical protein